MTNRRVHLVSGAIFLRCALAFFLVRELLVWRVIRRVRRRPGARLMLFLFEKDATPSSMLQALIFAALVTSLLALWVRLVLRPLVMHWHSPWTDGSAGSFHLAAGERVVDSSPARRKSGWRWPAGTLVRTNLRLWFFPRAHDDEPWSLPLASVRGARLAPAPRFAWGFIDGWPDRVVLQAGDVDRDGGDAGGDRAVFVFAVPDPDAVVSWFPPAQADAATGPAVPPLSTPRSL